MRAAQVAPGQHRLGGVRERRGERADEPLARDLERTARTGPEVRLAPVELVDPDARAGPCCRSPAPSRRSPAARRAARRSTRRAARRCARPGCPRARRIRRAARIRAPRDAPRACPASRRSRCGGAPCWPCSCRRRRPGRPRGGVTRSSKRVSSRAIAQPTTPAPTMATSVSSGSGTRRSIPASVLEVPGHRLDLGSHRAAVGHQHLAGGDGVGPCPGRDRPAPSRTCRRRRAREAVGRSAAPEPRGGRRRVPPPPRRR